MRIMYPFSVFANNLYEEWKWDFVSLNMFYITFFCKNRPAFYAIPTVAQHFE